MFLFHQKIKNVLFKILNMLPVSWYTVGTPQMFDKTETYTDMRKKLFIYEQI